MSDRYWLLPPGSTEPPQGPFELAELKAKWHTSQIPVSSTICKIGDFFSDWVTIESVLGPREDSPQSASPPADNYSTAGDATARDAASQQKEKPLSDRDSIEAKYKNLSNVAVSLKTWGNILQVLGVIVAIVCLVAGFAWAPLFIGVVFGIVLLAFGTITAAMGEVLFAVRDTAVNTRVSADIATRALL